MVKIQTDTHLRSSLYHSIYIFYNFYLNMRRGIVRDRIDKGCLKTLDIYLPDLVLQFLLLKIKKSNNKHKRCGQKLQVRVI